MKIGILGDGSMAMAIAHLLKTNGHSSTIFSRKKRNITESLNADVIFLCVPSSAICDYAELVQSAQFIVSCAKGIAKASEPFISSFFDANKLCVLSGPNFADEILNNNKTITTLASKNSEALQVISALIASPNFEIEMNDEIIGIEICGIVKNVIAIMMGYASIKMPSWNEKSLLLTKMFQEVGIVLEYFKCNKSVLELSCGIGDIFLTCSSTNSRNYRFGIALAQEQKLENTTVEGLRSVEFIKHLPLILPHLKMVENFLMSSN
jgi:glycerol-3-phosphate dehydrogenase (NAD(P)+)